MDFTSYKINIKAKEIAQCVKWLAYKHKGLSLDLRHFCKKLGQVASFSNPSPRKAETLERWGQSVSRAEKASIVLNEGDCSINEVERWWRVNVWHQFLHLCP